MNGNERKAVVDEIFSLTGIAVDEDDPIVTAALFQSACITKAGDDVAANLSAIAERVTVSCEMAKTEAAVALAHTQELINRIPFLIKAEHSRKPVHVGDGAKTPTALSIHGGKHGKSRWTGAFIAAFWFAGGAGFAAAAGFTTGHVSATLSQDAAVGVLSCAPYPFSVPTTRRDCSKKLSDSGNATRQHARASGWFWVDISNPTCAGAFLE